MCKVLLASVKQYFGSYLFLYLLQDVHILPMKIKEKFVSLKVFMEIVIHLDLRMSSIFMRS